MGFVNTYRSEVNTPKSRLSLDLLRGGLITILLSSCASVPTPSPTVQTIDPSGQLETQLPEEVEDVAIAHAIEQDGPIISSDDPQTLVDQARDAPPEEAIPLLLLAISGFIESKQYGAAQILANQLSFYPLIDTETIALQLFRIKLTQATGQHNRSIMLLNEVNALIILNLGNPEVTPLRAEYLSLLADSQPEVGQVQSAIQALLLRDTLLQPEEQSENQQRIVSLLLSLDDANLSLLAQNAREPHLSGWVALTQLLSTSDQQELPFRLQQWRAGFPGHPVQFSLLQQYMNVGELERYRQIALLLPLNSPFGSAARSFYDGFIAANNEIPEFDRPDIVLYDIGEEPELSTFYYQAAINEGADFIVGPLGRQAVNAWLTNESTDIPTLVISNVPENLSRENLFGISLSPEREAAKIADKAYADGHRQAIIFRVDSQWGQRVADAFVLAWEKKGGKVIKNNSFPTDISDYSRIIQKLLSLDKSITRQKLLSAKMGFDLHFTPRRRDDVDFLFLAANAKQARLIVPQLRFFQAHNLPMYATSYIYSGEPNASVDADLDGVTLGEMSWMLNGVEQHKAELARKQRLVTQAQTGEEQENETQLDDTLTQNNDASTDDSETIATAETTNSSSVTAAGSGAATQQGNLQHAPEETSKTAPHQYTYSAMDRLYALGFESYQIIPKLSLMKENDWIRHRGKTMKISVDQYGNVEQHPTWVKFNQGLLERIVVSDN